MSKEEIGYRILQGFMPYTESTAEYTGYKGVTVNAIKRKNNTVIFNFLSEQGEDTTHGASNKITIPEEFRPKEEVKFYAMSTHESVSVTIPTCVEGVVGTDGTVTLTFYNTANVTYLNISNIGWEIKEANNG